MLGHSPCTILQTNLAMTDVLFSFSESGTQQTQPLSETHQQHPFFTSRSPSHSSSSPQYVSLVNVPRACITICKAPRDPGQISVCTTRGMEALSECFQCVLDNSYSSEEGGRVEEEVNAILSGGFRRGVLILQMKRLI